MKKQIIGGLAIAMAVMMTGMVSCGDKNADSAVTKEKKAEKKDAAGLPNYRYVDLDTLLNLYNLAKDYNEEMVRMQANAESAAKRHESGIQSLAAQMQQKAQNNVYQSQESYNQDQQKLQNLQATAQKEMGKLQENMEKSAMNAQKAVNDSIQAFIKEYNKKHGYDAIFFKAATLYIDERLDITKEVAEGLNARYNKVKK